MFETSYEQLQSAVLQARQARTPDVRQFSSIYEIVAQHGHIDETAFTDAVSWNLARGRAIIAVVGDGIREELMSLAEFVQGHAGHRFIFALIQMKIYNTPQGDARIVVLSVLAQTQLVERGVVQIEDNKGAPRIIVRPSGPSGESPTRRRPFGINEDEFYESLDRRIPGTSSFLKRFVEKAESRGIVADWQNGLNLKHSLSGARPALNLGTIWKDGIVDISGLAAGERASAARIYCKSVASEINGNVGGLSDAKYVSVKTAAGKMPRVTDFLPDHEEEWLGAMERYVRDVRDGNLGAK